jgi:hypothetical protein
MVVLIGYRSMIIRLVSKRNHAHTHTHTHTLSLSLSLDDDELASICTCNFWVVANCDVMDFVCNGNAGGFDRQRCIAMRFD